MSHHLYLTRTIHMPVTADGALIKNAFGVVIATMTNPADAGALAQIINLGQPAAQAADDAYDAQQDAAAALFARSLTARP